MGMTSILMQDGMCFARSSPTPRPSVSSYQGITACPHSLQTMSAEKLPETKISTVFGNQKSSEETEQNFLHMDPYIYT